MAFTDTQVRLLKAKLDPKHIRTRNSNGSTLSYVEGWHAIAECGSYRAVYVAKVRVTVRAGDVKVVREGSGTCESSAVTAGQAHELALKGAETDATKRALATFGNPFGLALYDREQTGVRKLRAAVEANLGPWILRSGAGSPLGSYQTPSAFIEALRRAMSDARDIELLYDVWEKNVQTLRTLHRQSKEKSEIVPKLVAHLRSCAVAIVKRAGTPEAGNAAPSEVSGERRVDKSILTIANRSEFVARSICVTLQANLVRSADDHPLMPTT